MHPLEPKSTDFTNPIKRYFLATRPAFLSATLLACLLGVAGAIYDGIKLHWLYGITSIAIALVLHAAVNVLNDYFDALNGTDAINEERIYPFTGGSRFIQTGILTPKQTQVFGYTLLAIAIMGGLWLVAERGFGLLVIGFVGVVIGWAYSASPLKLNSRGLGELAVFLGFLGLVVGADFVQRGQFSCMPYIAGVPYALLVTNLLFINQFPDIKADQQVGKYHLVIRLTPRAATKIYAMIVAMAIIWLLTMIVLMHLPIIAFLSLLPLVLSCKAASQLMQHYQTPQKLRTPIQWTIMAMLSHALILSIILFWK